MEFSAQMTVEEAVRRLRSSVRAAGSYKGMGLDRPHLEGEITRERVVLYRRRGLSNWYGRFEGVLAQEGAVVKLKGHFVGNPPIFLYLASGFLLLWALGVAVTVILRWQGADSIAWLVAAILAGAVSAGAIGFRMKNVQAEKSILFGEIERSLGRSDV